MRGSDLAVGVRSGKGDRSQPSAAAGSTPGVRSHLLQVGLYDGVGGLQVTPGVPDCSVAADSSLSSNQIR